MNSRLFHVKSNYSPTFKSKSKQAEQDRGWSTYKGQQREIPKHREKKYILITRQKSPQKTDFTLSVQSFAIKLPQTHENLDEKRFINATICLHGKGLK